jgi:hypothetical protein
MRRSFQEDMASSALCLQARGRLPGAPAPPSFTSTAVNHLKVRSCLIDGEVVCCDEPIRVQPGSKRPVRWPSLMRGADLVATRATAARELCFELPLEAARPIGFA